MEKNLKTRKRNAFITRFPAEQKQNPINLSPFVWVQSISYESLQHVSGVNRCFCVRFALTMSELAFVSSFFFPFFFFWTFSFPSPPSPPSLDNVRYVIFIFILVLFYFIFSFSLILFTWGLNGNLGKNAIFEAAFSERKKKKEKFVLKLKLTKLKSNSLV